MSSSATLGLIFLVFTVVSFMLEKIPLAVTALISSLLYALFIPEVALSTAYSGWSATTVLMVMGMMVVGDSLFQTGMAQKIGSAMTKSSLVKNERWFNVAICAMCTVLSAFLSNSGCIAMMMPLIGAAVVESNGALNNKRLVMGAAIGCAIGGGATLVGSTSQLTANGVLQKLPGFEDGMGLFDMTKGMLPLCIIMLIYFATIGYTIEKKVFPVDDSHFPEMQDDAANIPAWKGTLSVATLLLCVLGFVLTGYQPFKSWFNVAIIGMVGMAILTASGVMPLKPTLRNLDWNTLMILAMSQGFASGVDKSGAGKVIADGILNLFGGETASYAALMIAGILVNTILTQFMSNTALAAMMTPIYIEIAKLMGINPLSFVIMIACATNIACATPVGTPCLTQAMPTGYKYMDYMKVGGPLFIILVIAACILFPMIYPSVPYVWPAA